MEDIEDVTASVFSYAVTPGAALGVAVFGGYAAAISSLFFPVLLPAGILTATLIGTISVISSEKKIRQLGRNAAKSVTGLFKKQESVIKEMKKVIKNMGDDGKITSKELLKIQENIFKKDTNDDIKKLLKGTKQKVKDVSKDTEIILNKEQAQRVINAAEKAFIDTHEANSHFNEALKRARNNLGFNVQQIIENKVNRIEPKKVDIRGIRSKAKNAR